METMTTLTIPGMMTDLSRRRFVRDDTLSHPICAAIDAAEVPVIKVTCDSCDKPFEVDSDAQPGEKVSCPYCGDVNRIGGLPAGVVPVMAKAEPVRARPPSVTDATSVQGEEPEQTLMMVRQAMFRAHPFWYLLMILLGLGGLVTAVLSLGAAPMLPAIWLTVGLVALAVSVLWWIIWWAAPHRWIRLTITTKRTIRSEGIIMKKTSEVLHRHVTNVTIEQGLMDRIFGVGYIGIDSAGQGGEPEGGGDSPRRRSPIEIEVDNVPHPYRIKEAIDKYR